MNDKNTGAGGPHSGGAPYYSAQQQLKGQTSQYFPIQQGVPQGGNAGAKGYGFGGSVPGLAKPNSPGEWDV
jgi:hypothetical protein